MLTGIWATVFLPAEPLLWEPFLSNPVLVAWRRYFRFSAICETKVDLRKKYVFAGGCQRTMITLNSQTA